MRALTLSGQHRGGPFMSAAKRTSRAGAGGASGDDAPRDGVRAGGADGAALNPLTPLDADPAEALTPEEARRQWGLIAAAGARAHRAHPPLAPPEIPDADLRP